MSAPNISVIIPTYNRADLLRQALDSVGAQTYRDFETLVIDDGSDEDIAAALADHPTRPRIIRQANAGPAAARNRGIEQARGEWIAFLDSDDVWLPNKLERYVGSACQADDGQIMYGPMSPMDDQGHDVPGRTKPCYNGWITQHLFCSSFVHVPTVVCRKTLLERYNGFDPCLPVCEDYDLWLRISLDHPFLLIEEPLARRRLHGNRLSKSLMCRNLAVKAEVLQRFYDSPGATSRLDAQVGASRLAKVWFSAARAAFHSGHHQQAQMMCRRSRALGHPLVRTLPLSMAAMLKALFARSSQQKPSGPAAHLSREPVQRRAQA